MRPMYEGAEHDDSTEWWRRYQWAAEQVNQADNLEAQEFGRAVMSALADEPTVTDSEIAILQAVAAQRETENNGEHPEGGRDE